ncbi:MAG TPA: hypothetical protein VFO38_06425 [Candidatus Saccharimonadales bacterium]|nr:hypothetical protein [Candidatus Saccharimonadales bacterium]
MFVKVRVFGPEGHRAFKDGNEHGSFKDYAGLELVPGVIQKVAIMYQVVAMVARNGYNLGTLPSPVNPSVMVTATGDRVTFTALDLDTAFKVWNHHAEEMGKWMQGIQRVEFNLGTPFEIRAYGENPMVYPHIDCGQQYAAVKTFGEAARFKDATFFRVGSIVPLNYHTFGVSLCGENGDVEVIHTGNWLVVGASSLEAAKQAFNDVMLKLHACVVDEHAAKQLL